jgi:pyruvate ferredoxin oxidoreductase alpha subunit
MTMLGLPTAIDSIIAGLGGRPITRDSLHEAFRRAIGDQLDKPHFLDLKPELIERQLERMAQSRRSGAFAESILRDLGVVAAAKTG